MGDFADTVFNEKFVSEAIPRHTHQLYREYS